MDYQGKLTKKEVSVKVDGMHREVLHWKSCLQFIQDELTFIKQLLNSYVFEPNTPNLFERLQDYKAQIKKSNTNLDVITEKIGNHEHSISGLLECTDTVCDTFYHQKHEKLKAETVAYLEMFKDLKYEIFEYAGGILKKRKPDF